MSYTPEMEARTDDGEIIAPKEAAWRQGWRIAKAHPRLFWACMFAYLCFYMAPLLPGLLQKEIFDTLTGHREAGLDIWTLIGLLFAAQLLPQVIVYFAFWGFWTFMYSATATLRANMLGWLMHAPGPRKPPGPPGEALSRFRDDAQEVRAFVDGWIDVFGQLVFAFVALGIMWTINPQVTLAVIAPMVLVVIITQRITYGIHRYSRVAREAAARVTSYVGESFAAVQAIRVAGAEPRMLDRLDALNDERRRTAVRYRIYVALLETFGVGTSSFALGLVLLLAASSMRTGAFTVGDFTLFAAYVGWATSAPRWMGRLLARKRTADVALSRIDTLLGDAPEPILTGAKPVEPQPALAHDPLRSLKISGLTAIYPRSGRGVRDIDFELERGTITIVTGRVGSGKTTLLRAILGLAPSQAGELHWNGARVADPATFLAPPRCAYTAQAPRLFSETLRENVLMGIQADDETLRAAVELAILEDDVDQLAAGYDTMVGTRGITLSGGQAQRTAAARMLVRRADLLVFDDASSALDVRTEQMFWDRLFDKSRTDLSGDRTCLAVSHRRGAFQRADQILVLEDGVIAARGELQTLLRDSALFRSIWNEEVVAETKSESA